VRPSYFVRPDAWRVVLVVAVVGLLGVVVGPSASNDPSGVVSDQGAFDHADSRANGDESVTGGTSGGAEPVGPTDPEAPKEPIRVAVTATGVPVAVVDHTPQGHVVTSPCGTSVVLDAVTALDPVTVVLDPGHGGPVDTGAVGPNGLRESDINLAVAQAVASELEDRGISAALTRTADYALPIQVRTAFAEAAEADLMLSVHHNAPASARSAVPGTEVYVQSTSAESGRLGGIVYEETMASLARFDVAWTRRHDAGVVQVLLADGRDAYGILRLSPVPTALVELGYLANPSEAAFFATDAYVAAVATALADSTESYLTTDRAGDGHVQPARNFTPRRSHAPDECADPPLGD